MPPEDYISLLKTELKQKSLWFPKSQLDTVYFGGGTPSLLSPPLIVSVIEELSRSGFLSGPSTEITIEINPATLDEEKLRVYLDAGINRFSVGAQTFDDALLKSVKREHNARQTLETLELLQKFDLSYTFDILFALPGQTISGLKKDLDITAGLGARHISPYCLTVPDGHPLSTGRPPEEAQVEMFDLIADRLTGLGFQQYEISNFAKPGYESRHNILYWSDESYWGLGLSAHSYRRQSSISDQNEHWGTRFWNPSAIGEYQKLVSTTTRLETKNPQDLLGAELFEDLDLHQSLTDYCHTSLRMMRGLSEDLLLKKYGKSVQMLVLQRLQKQQGAGALVFDHGHWCLTKEGLLISNKVFQELTFLKNEIPPSTR